MFSALLLLVGLATSSPQAFAGPPLPAMLSVFVCQTVSGHHIEDMAKQGTEVMPAPGWVDSDWAYENKLGVPLKECTRTYVAITDMSAKALAADTKAISVHPDASDPTQCAWLAMQIISVLPHDLGIIVGCPHAVKDSHGNVTAYEDPPCPLGCDCQNEPQDL